MVKAKEPSWVPVPPTTAPDAPKVLVRDSPGGRAPATTLSAPLALWLVTRCRPDPPAAAGLPLLPPVLPRVAGIVVPPVHGHLGEPGIADEPDHRAVGGAGVLAAVDGPLGEQRAALVDHVCPGRDGQDQLAAEGVDLQRDLAARQHGVGQVDDQRAEMCGQPGAPAGHPAPGADHLAEARGA